MLDKDRETSHDTRLAIGLSRQLIIPSCLTLSQTMEIDCKDLHFIEKTKINDLAWKSMNRLNNTGEYMNKRGF